MNLQIPWKTLALLSFLLVACNADETPTDSAPGVEAAAPMTSAVVFDRSKLGVFGTLPTEITKTDNPITPAKVELGRMLYYEARLSRNHDISCNSCHMLDKFGVDNQPTSPGHKGQRGARNSPTVYNAAGHMAQFWDGRAADVEEQAKGPVLNPVEMAMPDEAYVLKVLASMPEYVEKFATAFPNSDPSLTYDNMGNAIGAFERTLVTTGRWDAFLGGEDGALTEAEKEGLNAFLDTGCTACHSGPYLGGNMYQKVGLVKPWPNQKDLGRFEVTNNDADKMMFKSPGLRNIAMTGPYFHDGSVADLTEAVSMMAEYQLGKELSAETSASIVTFLKALDGELPKDKIAKPELPQSTEETPKADPS